ncbi:MAG: ChuX/HutX family heme-like substrate-binding protein, partial [Neisseria sp.]|nr:ChuX/HutX family heme-like substrate-binding protein [Neisseria sp.]
MSENLTLWQRYQAKKASVGGIYFTKEGAADLGVSEGALIATSPDAVYLGKDCRALLMRLHELGEVMAIVRNSLCVHEKMGVYQNVKLSETGGIALNFGGIDLRIFLSAWQHALAVENHDGDKISRSIQFYSAQGDAIQKVFLREESEA